MGKRHHRPQEHHHNPSTTTAHHHSPCPPARNPLHLPRPPPPHAPLHHTRTPTSHADSTIWNDLEIRDDDVIVATYAKSGTTWTQQIVGQLLSNGDPAVEIASKSPWVDLRVPPKEVKKPELDAMPSRRFLKTHLPLDALVFSPKAKYIYVGRDGRDVVWSMYNHHANANDLWYGALNDTPGRVGPPIERPVEDIHQYYQDWLDKDGHPFWPFWQNLRTWWEHRHQPNVRTAFSPYLMSIYCLFTVFSPGF
ncbi:P-loop containing nucleoside triphosphate hydrolase protein [Ochromonadaceae sp. CCMP2298]|nr:P-loop containing nucleoside triphosphate hydrolase protein [Ochromonadaceae sp. CCMP2298]